MACLRVTGVQTYDFSCAGGAAVRPGLVQPAKSDDCTLIGLQRSNPAQTGTFCPDDAKPSYIHNPGHNNMRSYQVLGVVGGVIGLVLVLAVYAVLGSLMAFMDALGSQPEDTEIFFNIGVSAVLYIAAIILPFVIKSHKVSGCGLIVLAVATLISAGMFGIVGFAILIAGGIAGLRWHDKPNRSTALDVLKERYARGEITKEEYEKMRSELESS